MPKISVRGNGEALTLKVTGALIGPWVDELKRCWEMLQAVRKDRALRVDVSAVTNLSPDARRWLGQIQREGARFETNVVPSNAFVDELTRRALGRVVERDLNEWPRPATEQTKAPDARPRKKSTAKQVPGRATV